MGINKESIIGIVIIVCGVLFFIEASSIRNLGYDILDTSFFPKLTSFLLIISGIGLFINNLSKRKKKDHNNKVKKYYLKVFTFITSFILYLIILPSLHFIFSTVLFIMASYLIIDPCWNIKNIIKGLAFSILLSYGFWFIFEKGFNVLLP